jgi:hypothetical protein
MPPPERLLDLDSVPGIDYNVGLNTHPMSRTRLNILFSSRVLRGAFCLFARCKSLAAQDGEA